MEGEWQLDSSDPASPIARNANRNSGRTKSSNTRSRNTATCEAMTKWKRGTTSAQRCPREKPTPSLARRARMTIWNHKTGKPKKRTKPSRRATKSGGEVLRGAAWRKRVAELEARSEGICEGHLIEPGHPKHFIGHYGDPHHLIPRSKGRTDILANLLWICRELHMALDRRKTRFGEHKGC